MLTENAESQVVIAVPGLTTVRTDLEAAAARVTALETAGDDIPGRLKVDDALQYDSDFALHIGADRTWWREGTSTS